MSLSEQAQAILDRCDPTTPREQIVWAAGVTLLGRAFYFARLPILQGHLPGWGGALPGRSFNCERDGMHLLSSPFTASPEVVPTIRWREISALVTLDRIGIDLHGRIVANVGAQQARQSVKAPQRRPWEELMAESQDLAGQVWARCRPGATRQLDVFDALAGAR